MARATFWAPAGLRRGGASPGRGFSGAGLRRGGAGVPAPWLPQTPLGDAVSPGNGAAGETEARGEIFSSVAPFEQRTVELLNNTQDLQLNFNFR